LERNKQNYATCEAGGFEVFWDEIDKLGDPARQIKVAGAFFPDLIREALKWRVQKKTAFSGG
jgi:hypothetical protein